MGKLLETTEKVTKNVAEVATKSAVKVEDTGAKIKDSLVLVHNINEDMKDTLKNGAKNMIDKVDPESVVKIAGGIALAHVAPGAGVAKIAIDNKDKIVDGVKIGAEVAGNVVKDATEKSTLFKIGTKIGSIVKDGGDKIRDRLVEFKDTAVDKGVAIGASLRDFVKENDVVPSIALGAGAGISTAASFANAGIDAARAGVEAVDCDGPEI